MKSVKEILAEVKGWGFTALASAGIGIFLFISGLMFWSGLAFGVFITRNWDIIAKFIREKTGANL